MKASTPRRPIPARVAARIARCGSNAAGPHKGCRVARATARRAAIREQLA